MRSYLIARESFARHQKPCRKRCLGSSINGRAFGEGAHPDLAGAGESGVPRSTKRSCRLRRVTILSCSSSGCRARYRSHKCFSYHCPRHRNRARMRRLCIWLEQAASLPSGSSATLPQFGRVGIARDPTRAGGPDAPINEIATFRPGAISEMPAIRVTSV